MFGNETLNHTTDLTNRGSLSNKEKALFFAQIISLLGVIYTIVNFSFSRAVRKRNKERARGICEGCGGKFSNRELIVAHVVHGQGPGQNDKNVMVLCYYCETTNHLDHFADPTAIGLCATNNRQAVMAHFWGLSPGEQLQIISDYHEEMEAILGKDTLKALKATIDLELKREGMLISEEKPGLDERTS